jgi:hypothetical protein
LLWTIPTGTTLILRFVVDISLDDHGLWRAEW